jgi:hypothetical protein
VRVAKNTRATLTLIARVSDLVRGHCKDRYMRKRSGGDDLAAVKALGDIIARIKLLGKEWVPVVIQGPEDDARRDSA